MFEIAGGVFLGLLAFVWVMAPSEKHDYSHYLPKKRRRSFNLSKYMGMR